MLKAGGKGVVEQGFGAFSATAREQAQKCNISTSPQ